MGLFSLGSSLKGAFGDLMQERDLKDKLDGTDLKDPMERAKMARQLEGVQKRNQGGFLSNVGNQMMSNAKDNLGLGGFQGNQTPMIGAMGPGPQGQAGLGGIASPEQMMQMRGMQAAGRLPYMPTGNNTGIMMGKNNMLVPMNNTQGLLGALNVPEDYTSPLKRLGQMFMMGG